MARPENLVEVMSLRFRSVYTSLVSHTESGVSLTVCAETFVGKIGEKWAFLVGESCVHRNRVRLKWGGKLPSNEGGSG